MGDLCAFLRPVEITASNNSFAMGGGKTIDVGTYGSILTVLNNMQSKIAATYANAKCFIDADGKVRIWKPLAGGTVNITWTDTDLAALLGFEDDVVAGTDWETYTHTVVGVGATDGYVTKASVTDHTPEYVWLPTYAVANQAYFDKDVGKITKGRVAANGIWSGYTQGGTNETPYERDFEFVYEPAANVAKTFETESFQVNGGGTMYYPNQDRCLEEFAVGSRSARPTSDANAALLGCYYLNDRTDYMNDTFVEMPTSMDAGGVRFDDAGDDDPDKYVWGYITKPPPTPTAGLPSGRQYYNVGFTMTTATSAPTWDN